MNMKKKINMKMEKLSYNSKILFIQKILDSFFNTINVSIKNKKCNGKDCYYIENFKSSNNIEENSIYIDKETGLLVKSESKEIINEDGSKSITPTYDYLYNFDIIENDIFVEPSSRE